MRSTTSTYKQIIASGNTRQFHVKVNMTLVDDTQLTITDSDIMQGSFKYEMASSSTTSFDLGSAVIGMCKFQLENYDERYTGYDFFNGEAVVWVKLEGDSEFIRLGFFTVDEPTFAGGMVSLELLDNMWKFDVPVSDVNMSFPISCVSAVNAVCNHCGVLLNTQQFHGYNFQLTVQPEQDMNCREFLQYVAMITCNFCVIDDAGKLNLKWYDTSSNPSASLDGGTFSTNTTPYSDGDTADGGNFTNYNSGADIDGGTFIENNNTAWFTRNFSASLGTDEITITGVKITIDDVVHRIGGEGYVLEIENPLVNESNVNDVLNLIWDVLNSFRLRTFSLYTLPDISAEIGDACAVRDLKGNIVYSFITLISFNLTAQTVECNAVTPTRKLATRYSKSVQTAVEEARKRTDSEISRYDVAVQMMNNLAVNAIGGYQDYEDLETGGRIYYLSNKPITKTEGECHFVTGSTVFKVSGEGFFVSEDGGQTWVNGYSHGELVVNVLNAIGINADWVQTGLLRDKDGYNYWDLDHNIFHLAGGTTVGTGGTTLDDFAEKDGTITDVDVEYAKNQSSSVAPTTGWSTDSPQWEVGYYIWQRTKTTDGEGTVSYSDPACIQGAKGQDGNSIDSTTIEYGVSNNPSTMPSSWSTTLPSVADGQYLWTRTTIDYTDPAVQDTVSYSYAKQGQQGQAGHDGTSVTVTSIQYQQGDSATTPPSGTWSDSPIIVQQGKYLWTKTTYSDSNVAYTVAFQGQNGTNGQDGTGISSTTIEYGVSNNASTQPSSWSTTAPTTVAQGKWLWVRTTYTYTNSTTKTTYTKSYIGTDGDDGTSITVTSVVKVGKVTTVTFSDGSTMTIDDGEDGDDGVNGLNGYVHTAWALTVQGMDGATATTGFSTSVSSGKKYLGTYTDNSSPDSQTWSDYSWSLIKGADGEDGDDGVGVTAIVEQYAKNQSTSTAPTTGWSSAQPVWENGYYIWTRSEVTWTDGTVTTTTPVLAQGINQANKKAYDTDEGLNQYEIMSRLAGGDPTNPNQGIFLYNNKVYINAEFLKAKSIKASDIATDTLLIGGSSYSDNAKLLVQDTGDHDIVRLNKDGVWAQQGTIGDLTLEDGELYGLGEYLLRDTKTYNTGSNQYSGSQYVVPKFVPVQLYLASPFKIKIDYTVSNLNIRDSRVFQFQLTRETGSSSTIVYSSDIPQVAGSYSVVLDYQISNTDTNEYIVKLYRNSGLSSMDVTARAYIDSIEVVSLSREGIYGTFKGSVFGIGNFDSLTVTDLDADNMQIGNLQITDNGIVRTTDEDAYKLDFTPTLIRSRNSSTQFTRLNNTDASLRIQDTANSYIDIMTGTPEINVYKSSSEYIRIKGNNPSIHIQDSSSEYLEVTAHKLRANTSSSQYVEISDYPKIEAYNDDYNFINISADDKKVQLSYDSTHYVIFQGGSNKNLLDQRGSNTYSIAWTSSDRRNKENIEDLDVELSKNFIDATETKQFKYKDSEGKHYGMIAQDVRELLDNLGETDAHLEYCVNEEDEYDPRNINYSEYIPHLINYVKDLRAELNRVKAELNELKEG